MLSLTFTPFPTLSSQRLDLRELQLSDDQDIFELRSNEYVRRYLNRPVDRELSESQYFIKNIARGIENKEWIYWGLALKSSKRVVGTICLWNISLTAQCAEIGYEIRPDYQGQGLMQEAMELILAYGFNQMNLNQIEAWLHAENKRSIRLLERNQFQYIRLAAPEEKFESESDMEMITYSLSKESFRTRNKT